MKSFIKDFEELFDLNWYKENVVNMFRIERKQTFPAYKESIKYLHDLVTSEGFQSEYVEFPADGKTDYHDKCMPIGWDVSEMRLTLKSKINGIDDPVIADYQREPLHAVKHSVSTPPEGLSVRIITEAQMKLGADVTGALILLDRLTPPRLEPVRMLLDLGAIGWVSDYSENPCANPDSVFWGNSETEYGLWHVHGGDREFISFQITERCGNALRHACECGCVEALVESDARRYETVYPALSVLLPGESDKEIWLAAHTAEPLISDNVGGVMATVLLLKALRTLRDAGKIKLKYSIRAVFASELYGMSAMTEYYGGDLSARTIGAINMDGFTSSKDKLARRELTKVYAQDNPAFFGNILLDEAAECFKKVHPEYEILTRTSTLSDDTFFGDTTIGMPTVWILQSSDGYHHNSAQDESLFAPEASIPHFAFIAEWVRAIAGLEEDEVKEILPRAVERANATLAAHKNDIVRYGTDMSERAKYYFEREIGRIKGLSLYGAKTEIYDAIKGVIPCPTEAIIADEGEHKWFDYADEFVFARAMRGLPHDLLRMPKERRTLGYGGMLYMPFAQVFSRMDGIRTLKDAITIAEWDRCKILSDKEIKRWIHYCTEFSDYGYLHMKKYDAVTKENIEDALKKVGVKEGACLLVHSGLSSLGYIDGGTNTVIDALKSAVGDDGTLIAPIFTFPYLMFDGDVNKGYGFRPYDTRKDGNLRDLTIRTGALGKAILKTSGAHRSNHATHEWVALGKDATACTETHGLLERATNENSPMKHALDRNGDVIFIGCGLGSNTFIHFVEIMAGVDFAEPACIQYVDEDGRVKTTMIDGELFGCRNFYEGIEDKFYRIATNMGLEIYEADLGLDKVYRINLRQLYDITMKMFEKDRYATLCKSPDCPFCKRIIKKR